MYYRELKLIYKQPHKNRTKIQQQLRKNEINLNIDRFAS